MKLLQEKLPKKNERFLYSELLLEFLHFSLKENVLAFHHPFSELVNSLERERADVPKAGVHRMRLVQRRLSQKFRFYFDCRPKNKNPKKNFRRRGKRRAADEGGEQFERPPTIAHQRERERADCVQQKSELVLN